MTEYRAVWPMLSGIRTSSAANGGTPGARASIQAYAGEILPGDVLPEEIDRLLADGAIEPVEFASEAA